MRVIPVLEYSSRSPDREDILQVSCRFYEEFLKASPQNSQDIPGGFLKAPSSIPPGFLAECAWNRIRKEY